MGKLEAKTFLSEYGYVMLLLRYPKYGGRLPLPWDRMFVFSMDTYLRRKQAIHWLLCDFPYMKCAFRDLGVGLGLNTTPILAMDVQTGTRLGAIAHAYKSKGDSIGRILLLY